MGEEEKQAEPTKLTKEQQEEIRKSKVAQQRKDVAEYKAYIKNLEENVKRMGLEVEEMELFVKSHNLKKEVADIQQQVAKDMEIARQIQLAKEDKKEEPAEIVIVKQGEARKEEEPVKQD